MAKKDDGIAVLSNGLLIPEAIRDELLKHDWSTPRNKKEGFDPNNATTKDLELNQFSGYRVNVFTHDLELWCLGQMKVRRRLDDCTPQVMATMHEEAFMTTGTVISVPAVVKQRKVRRNAKQRTRRRR